MPWYQSCGDRELIEQKTAGWGPPSFRPAVLALPPPSVALWSINGSTEPSDFIYWLWVQNGWTSVLEETGTYWLSTMESGGWKCVEVALIKLKPITILHKLAIFARVLYYCECRDFHIPDFTNNACTILIISIFIIFMRESICDRHWANPNCYSSLVLRWVSSLCIWTMQGKTVIITTCAWFQMATHHNVN